MAWSRADRTLLVLLALSLVWNVFNEVGPILRRSSYDSLRLAGREAPPIAAVTLEGEEVLLKPDSKPMLLYVLAPNCVWCRLNTANMNALAEQVGDRYEIVGMSLLRDGLEAYLESNSLPFPVHLALDHRDQLLAPYGFGATPALYLIGTDRRIERAWGGAFTGASKSDAEKALQVHLPGI